MKKKTASGVVGRRDSVTDRPTDAEGEGGDEEEEEAREEAGDGGDGAEDVILGPRLQHQDAKL